MINERESGRIADQKERKLGLLVKGENSQGIELNTINKARPNQMSKILKRRSSVSAFLLFRLPMSRKIAARIIMLLCSIPKKRICRKCTAVLKCVRKYCVIGLNI